MKTKKQIIVTGASGLIGHDLIKKLSFENNVFALSRSKISINNVTYIYCDLSNDNFYNKLPSKVDVIFHLAQSQNFRNFPDDSKDIFNVNTISTLNLLEYARSSGCQKFIYASSGGVYGNSTYGFNEDQPLVQNKNLGFYLTSKFCSELILDNYKQFFNIIISRFFFVYGERQNKSMFIPRLIENIKKGKTIDLHGKEGININPVYVDDAVNMLDKMLSLESSNKINIAGGEIVTLKSICQIIGNILNIVPKFNSLDIKPPNLIGDIDKMTLLLDHPKISIYDGIVKTINNDFKSI